MNITINTATIQQGDKEVPLTRAIVLQLPYLPDILRKGWTREGLQCIGCVMVSDQLWYLYETPDGVHRHTSHHTHLGNMDQPKRIILIK